MPESKNEFKYGFLKNHWINIIIIIGTGLFAGLFKIDDNITSAFAKAAISALALVLVQTLFFWGWWNNGIFDRILFSGIYEKNGDILKKIERIGLLVYLALIFAIYLLSTLSIFIIQTYDIPMKMNLLITSRGDSEWISYLFLSVFVIVSNGLSYIIAFNGLWVISTRFFRKSNKFENNQQIIKVEQPHVKVEQITWPNE